ncbi:LDB1 [Lepeophtheirus salmonis]|uniref:LDB1 n=1 Tax=Lepeophtheirus salmonis TaxID=72036 RepID=A0A7R8CN35_LEPSM|nr:LDB1 [Lepeophtheirus salmonis]CAF2870878.1 LDB1 [Lepeophtheirus salmonis]
MVEGEGEWSEDLESSSNSKISIILEEPVSNWRGHYPGSVGMENGPLGGGGGGPSPNFASPNGPGTPTMPGTPTYPIQNYGPSPVGGPSQLVPCGPPSGPHGFVGSPVGNSGPSTPGPMVHTPIGNGGGPGNSNGPNSNILNNGGNSNIVQQPPPPPPNHCGQQPPNSFSSSTSVQRNGILWSVCAKFSFVNFLKLGWITFSTFLWTQWPSNRPSSYGEGECRVRSHPHHHQYLGGPPQNYGPPPGMHHPGMSPGHHGAPMGPHMGAPPPHFMDRMDPNRHMAMPPQPDYRIHEMNKRLQQRTDDNGPKRYTISRTLIPRYFRKSFHNNSITMDCDQCTVVTLHGKPMFTKSIIKKVFTEGRLVVEFSFDDSMRIRSWHFSIRNHRELIPRSVLALQDPGMPMESLPKTLLDKDLRVRLSTTSGCVSYWNLCKSSCQDIRRML